MTASNWRFPRRVEGLDWWRVLGSGDGVATRKDYGCGCGGRMTLIPTVKLMAPVLSSLTAVTFCVCSSQVPEEATLEELLQCQVRRRALARVTTWPLGRGLEPQECTA